MKKVLLLSMPFGALERPSLGLSLLKAKLEEENIFCEIRYLAFPFADFIGTENYQWMCYELPYTAFAGDWSFTSALYGDKTESSQENYVGDILQATWHLDRESINRILYIKSHVPVFIEYCLNSIQWEYYSIVGFTSTFEQNIASLALAKKIKQLHPGVVTVFGGANWEMDMGCELHKCFPFVDYVCSGESEESFSYLVKHIFSGSSADTIEKQINGIVLRKNGVSVFTGSPERAYEMDSLPYPDFSDYFKDLEESSSSKYILPTLLFETSRGCWWGAKAHCTFCGLNGGSMSFRSKSPKRVLDELDYLVSSWKTESVEVVDNILDMKYFDSVIPALGRAKRPIQIFYEVKSNLKREQVKLLSRAGISRIQPGIESLSNHVLKLMRKGTSGLRNLQLLKWAKEFNVLAEWNLLYGFPGETREDYDEILQILPAIRFLDPPCAVGPIRLDRFSPYFNSPADFGLINLRPLVAYRYLYPFDTDSLMRIAYYFEFDYESDANPANYAADVIEYIAGWKRDPEKGTLFMIENADGELTLIDTRSDTTIGQLHLNGMEQTVYEYCDEVRSLANIVGRLQEAFPGVPFSEDLVENFLLSLVANRLMVTDGSGYLSLAIQAQAVANPETKSENGVLDNYRKSLSSYLPRELPVLAVETHMHQPTLRTTGQL
jgi:ribosomal peptide maturation radical SAM protein 1